MDPHLLAWVNGCKDKETGEYGFWVEFYCPLCPRHAVTNQMKVPIQIQYDAGVGPDKSRSDVCPNCKHCFVVSTGDILYAREQVRELKKFRVVLLQKFYPCQYTHTPELCHVAPCNNPAPAPV